MLYLGGGVLGERERGIASSRGRASRGGSLNYNILGTYLAYRVI